MKIRTEKDRQVQKIMEQLFTMSLLTTVKNTPGKCIERLSFEEREILQTITADDINNLFRREYFC